MKRIVAIIVLSCLVFILSVSAYKTNDSKRFTKFVFRALYNPQLKNDYFGIINDQSKEIVVHVPKNVDKTKLTPSFSYIGFNVKLDSDKQISDIDSHDFSKPVFYKIMANNLSSNTYRIRVVETDETTIQSYMQYIKLRRLAELREPDLLRKMSDFQKAVILRNHVYQTTPAMKAAKNMDPNDLFDYYFLGSMHPSYGQLCQGLAITYQALLEAFQIPSRAVYMFSSTSNFSSHASVEVYIDGKWIVSDPNFNVMPKYGNKYLSFKEVRELLQQGKIITWDSNNMRISPINSRNIERYYISIDKLVKYMVVSPSKVKIKDEVVQSPAEYYPSSWDRKIIIEGKPVKIPDIYFYEIHPQMRTSMGEYRFAY